MANRVVITICGEEYTLVADETSAYMQKVGNCVSDKMTEVMNDAKVGRTDAAVLTAVNLTDELFKSQASGDPAGESSSRAITCGCPDAAEDGRSPVSAH